jgi:hypothetical protein
MYLLKRSCDHSCNTRPRICCRSSRTVNNERMSPTPLNVVFSSRVQPAMRVNAENKVLLSSLSTTGSYVRKQTGEPLCFSNITGKRERSASGANDVDPIGCRRAAEPVSAIRLFTDLFNSRKCAAADILRALSAAAAACQGNVGNRNALVRRPRKYKFGSYLQPRYSALKNRVGTA